MARSKRASVTRRSTPASVIPHTARRKLRHQRHLNLKQKHASTTQRREDDLEDTYVSLLRSIHDAEDDDDASSDGTDINASSDDQLEEWDEDAALVEMLGSPYLMPFFSNIQDFFAHQKLSSEYNEEHILQELSSVFADASHGMREEIVLGLRPVLKKVRDTRPAPGRAFIAGLLGFDDACKVFESSYRNPELDAAYAKIEVCITNTNSIFPFLLTIWHANRWILVSFSSGLRQHTVVSRKSVPHSRSKLKNRVHLSLSLSLPDMLMLILWDCLESS